MAQPLWQNDYWQESNFHFTLLTFQNCQTARWFEIKSPMSEILQSKRHSGAASSSCNAWNKIMQACLKKKRNSFLYFFWKENSLEMFCLRNTNLFDSPFKVLHKTVSDSWREMCQKIRLHIPFEWWKQFLKRRKRIIVGIVSGCNSKWEHWKEQRFKGQGEGRWRPDRLYLKPSAPPWVLQSWGVASPSGRLTFRAFFPLWHSNGIFYGDFTFPCLSTWKETHSLSF